MRVKKKYISELCEGQKLEDLFTLGRARRAQARNGPYWQLVLVDRTGEMNARIWSPASQNYAVLKEESIVFVRGVVQAFGQELQLNIEHLETVDPAEADWKEFLPVSDPPPEELFAQLCDFLHHNLQYKPWRNLYRRIFRDEEIKQAMLNAPGGKSIHHAYMGGLLEHTLAVCRICKQCAGIYPELDSDILLLAAAVHDLGKAYEITPGLSRTYTDAGQLLGHIILGLQVLEPYLEKSRDLDPELILHLRHIIVSHHGEFEYGSPKRPKTREAFVLHYADNMDAKLNTLRGSYADLDSKEGERWTGFNRPLGRYLYHPVPSPSPEKKQAKKKKDGPCLLPLKE
ncbi:MAG: 3'-5' exoribonuclease YhaM family protein [Desulfonatronovibrionaceae bacterium]